MHRFGKLPLILLAACIVLGLRSGLAAQSAPRLFPGDPPNAALIAISPPDDGGTVTIAGTAGSVYPTAAVAVRNLYTGETAYTQANIQGGFSVRLFGTVETPFWISPAPNIPVNQLDRPGSLPGGPGTILFTPPDNTLNFTIGGPAAGGSGRWTAAGSLNSRAFQPGDELGLDLNVTLDAPDLPPEAANLRMIGRLALQPVSGSDGAQAAGGLHSGSGWSNLLTPGGMAISGSSGDVPLAEVVVPAARITRRDRQLIFALNFRARLPENLPAGRYVPVLQGLAQADDTPPFTWEADSILGSSQKVNVPRDPLARVPLLVTVGSPPETTRLVFSLFQDAPSSGSRGLLAGEDRSRYALANLVRFDTPTYILPPRAGPGGDPIAYPLEPYLLNQLPNAYDTSAAPLIPFRFPSGRLSVRLVRPDGTTQDLGSAPILQNILSTPALDESALFGAQSVVDAYRLATLNPAFSGYVFEQYGTYTIQLAVQLEDVWGGAYTGGGTYTVLIAEPLDIQPGALPGTPYEVGDTFYPGLRVLPAAPADVTITARLYPLDGAPVIEKVIEGRANTYGCFYAADGAFAFETPGEYVIDYEARYTDAEGKLWAASERSAGVVASPDGTIVARGQRGLDGLVTPTRQAWFNASRYAAGVDSGAARLTYPYHSGDVVWLTAAPTTRFMPRLQAQDLAGAYHNWLLVNRPDAPVPPGLTLTRAGTFGELPLMTLNAAANPVPPALAGSADNLAYSYISAIRPDVSVRQFIAGGENAGLLFYWDWNDPLSGQPGAGVGGSRIGDYFFLFGGLVIKNAAADVAETAIYAAFAAPITPDDPLGPRVYPPYRGEAGGPDGGPLLRIGGDEVSMLFLPTGVRPGQVLVTGDTLAVAGQFAPTLASMLAVTVTAPDGTQRRFEGRANAIGYFYDPANDFIVDQPGLWTVEIAGWHDGLTSAGRIEPPPPVGSVPGAAGGRFTVYVVPPDTPALAWNDRRMDFAIPPAFPYNFNLVAPEDWRGIQGYHTVTTPAYVLSDGEIRVPGRSVAYQYNAANLSRVFPNLESNGQGDGAAASDVVTLTFAATGTDASGQFRIQVRVVTILHDRLVTFD